MGPLAAGMNFIQDEVAEKAVILSQLWEANGKSKSFFNNIF